MKSARYEQVQLTPLSAGGGDGGSDEDEDGGTLLRSEEGRQGGGSPSPPLLSSEKRPVGCGPLANLSWRDPRTVLGVLALALLFIVALETLVTSLVVSGSQPVGTEANSRSDGKRVDYLGRPRLVRGAFGVVASDQGDCSALGAKMLGRGGTAVDAAVATAFCLGVKNPFASGIGGGAFMLIRLSNGTAEAIDSREVAPGAASERMFVGDPSKALEGGLAVAVPMEALGLHEAWRRHGKLPWRDLVAPAAQLALGFPAHPYLVKSVKSHLGAMLKFKPLGKAFLNADGHVPKVGEFCCRRPELSATLRAIAEEGPEVLYSGPLAESLARDVQAAGCILTAADLRGARPRRLEVVETRVMGKTLLTFPPPSSGAVAVSILKQVEARGVPVATSGTLGKHRLLEAMKHSFAMRMSLGDPGDRARPFLDLAALDATVADLLSTEYAAGLVESTLDNTTQPQVQYGGARGAAARYLPDDNGTSHLSIVDAARNAVSMTTTINTGFGSKLISPSTGILLNNEMDDFSIPGAPNVYGLAPAEANYVRPGKKPLSSMSPMIVLEDGEEGAQRLKMVVGASGGPMIITAVVQAFLNVFDLEREPLSAVNAARLHDQLYPDRATLENYTMGWMARENAPAVAAVEEETVRGLERFGHGVRQVGWGLGNCQMVLFENATTAAAVSDARKDGAPAASER